MSDGAGRPVRVLWLIKGLGPGGAERLLISQAAARDPAAMTATAAYLVPWKDHLVGDLAELGVPSTCLDGPRELDLRWVLRLRRLLVQRPVDVVHVHSPYVAAITRLALRTLPVARRPALVFTEHNRWPRHDRLTRAANRWTYRLDDADLAVSADVRDTMPARHRARTEVLEHGVDLPVVRAAATRRHAVRHELGVADDEVLVVTVANLRREKALEVLLDAAARVLADPTVGPRCRFALVGQGPLADELAAHHRRLGLGDRFAMLGYRTDAPAVVAAGDVFCLSSRHEGRPVALMEALALGRPVVAAAAGGVPEVLAAGAPSGDDDPGEPAGALVPPDDPDALAAALATVIGDDDRRSAMARAAERLGDGVGIEPAQRRLESLYGELADARARRR